MAASSHQMTYPPTILQSFEEPLPHYPDNSSGLSADSQISGESTRETDPPKFWFDFGEFFFNQGVVTLRQRYDLLKHLNMEFIYRKEEAIKLLVEGDITRAAALYLLHPVNQTLSALNHHTQCLSEHAANRIRTDVSYKIAGSTFAVIEFKKRGTIRPDEFVAARRDIDNDNPNSQIHINQYIAAATKTSERTFFKGNSMKLMKQAGNYAVKEGTRYVALFDWNYLVLIAFRFNSKVTQQTREDNGPGEWCRIQSVRNPAKMRKALLGFLVTALNDM
ncbi:hypothetical protein F4678DRAFT_479483 [Xylaria arbuscula]|nr:hypothetical protein F4678DRAFT_479483 [Xylaria arbuscula]